jgi:glutaredoxin
VTPEFELTLIGKPGCHLCEEAQAVVASAIAEFDGEVTLVEKNILEDDALFAKYSEEIPVLLINGKVHNYWHIDPDRLKAALNA